MLTRRARLFRNCYFIASIFFSFLFFSCGSTSAHVEHKVSAKSEDIDIVDSLYFQDYWSGDIRYEGFHIPIGIKITDKAITLDNPAQGIRGIKAESHTVSNNLMTIKFADRMFNLTPQDRSSILLKTTANGRLQNIILTRNQPISELDRPQTQNLGTSKYQADSITFLNHRDKINLAGTLTIPLDQHPSALAILLTGSGPQDRDETLFGHKSFAVISDHLTKNGLGVLRFDDRGMGRSEGSQYNSTSFDFAFDAKAAFDYLKSKYPETPIGFIGHSEGGIVAQIADSLVQGAAFHIYLGAPGMEIVDLMIAQNELVLKDLLSDEDIQSYVKNLRPIFEVIIGDDEISVKQEIINQRAKVLYNSLNPQEAKKLAPSDMVFAMSMNGLLYNEWMLYFLSYNPKQYLSHISCPILALNGSRDIQVVPANLIAIKKNTSSTTDVSTLELKGLNHLFQSCTSCSVGEYGMLTESFSNQALSAMDKWLTAKGFVKK